MRKTSSHRSQSSTYLRFFVSNPSLHITLKAKSFDMIRQLQDQVDAVSVDYPDLANHAIMSKGVDFRRSCTWVVEYHAIHPDALEALYGATAQARNLRAGAIALILFLLFGLAAKVAMGNRIRDYLDEFAPTGDDEAVKGVYLTREALQHDDRLVALGSSELTFQDRYHAARLFANKPTGFPVYVVGSGYRQSLHNFPVLSALGEDVRGKRIVLFVSPTWFDKRIGEKAYRKNHSMLQAYEFADSAPLSPDLKRRGAGRLLELGGQAAEEPLLRSALTGLAKGDSLAG